jgi:hypothetical protein
MHRLTSLQSGYGQFESNNAKKKALERVTPGVRARRRDSRLTWGQLLASFCMYIDPLVLRLLEI